jgi:hypothetical protein
MKIRPWAKMPAPWIHAGKLKLFSWKEDGSQGTAALMIYYTMCQFATERPLRPTENPEPPSQTLLNSSLPPTAGHSTPGVLPQRLPNSSNRGPADCTQESVFVKPYPQALDVAFNSPEEPSSTDQDTKGEEVAETAPQYLIARLTYVDLNLLTGLSRERISAGLQKLMQVGMIWRVDGVSTYGLTGFGVGKRWAKLPGSALMSLGKTHFTPFKMFTLRSKHELNALKLHLYYANARAHNNAYCEAAYPTIHDRTGVPEKDIPRANAFLIACGILERTRGRPQENVAQHESNKYYLAGCNSFFIAKAAA